MKVDNLGDGRLLKQYWLEKIEKAEKYNYSTQKAEYYNTLRWNIIEIKNRKERVNSY